MRALPSPGLEAKGSSWMPCVDRADCVVAGESGSRPGERRGDSPATCDGDGDGDSGAVCSCALLSFSSVEKETVFRRFLRGGTRTIGDEGRGYGGDGGRLEGAVVLSALLSFASPERNRTVFKSQTKHNALHIAYLQFKSSSYFNG